jgi:RNA polymerase sigma factor (sigma-70 family)
MKPRSNEEWLRTLAAEGQEQAAAIEDLRAFLLRAALYAFSRYRGDLTRPEIDQLAEDSAQEALLAILRRLPDFRSDSKFTTWAYKFAINFALVAARRERWKAVSLDQLLDDELPEWPLLGEDHGVLPEHAALQAEVWSTLREVIDHDLTHRQRQVLIALVFNQVPLDELVRHFGSSRNTIYKLVHDARRKLKARLEARGFGLLEIMGLFSSKLRNGQVDLNDPATTVALLKLNAVVGVTGFFDDQGNLESMGIQCALCHSTVDNSFAPGIGHRLDGWANRDLDVGTIIALAPNLEPVADLLGVDVGTVRTVLHS